MHRGARFVLGLSALAVAASTALVAPAHAAKGQWSIGGNFGTGIYSPKAFNDSLDAAAAGSGFTIKHVTSGWEYGGSIRYGISPKASLDYELNLLNGKKKTDANSTTGAPEIEAKTTGLAGPVSLYVLLGTSEKSSINFFFGVGPMYSTKWKVTVTDPSTSTTTVTEAKGKTGLYAHAGLEGDYMLSKSVAVTARALGRYAKASDVTFTDPTTSAETKVDVSLSGAAFSLGLRAFFGKY